MIAVEHGLAGQNARAGGLSTSPQLLCIAGFDGFFKSLSASWETALDYTVAELRSRSFYEFVHEDDVEETMVAVRRIASGSFEGSLQNRFRRRDGSYRRLVWSAEPIVKDRTFFAVAQDLTDADARLLRRFLRR